MRTYRASSLGYSLESLVAGHLGYEALSPPEWLQEKFDEGTALEPIVLTELKARGWFIQDEQLEVELEVIPGVAKVVGHLDGTGHPDSLPWGVVEVKTMADKAWRDFALHGWTSSSTLIEKYKWQASAYQLATGKPHYMVAWNKATEEIHVEFVPEPFYSISDIANKLAQAEEYIEKGLVPEGCKDFPCPYYYLHAPNESEISEADEELDELLTNWLYWDKQEKSAKFRKDELRKLILASTGDNCAAKIKGAGGVVVETFWQDEKEYTVKQQGKWVTRVSGPRRRNNG